uniref:Uncharacterized protein n=1 Tax=Ralstonia solanacearum TaxID=305 RepID=A0A0S4WJX4_RALSL|nr:conserved protein of unknown function [Ralstonia solanacearum]
MCGDSVMRPTLTGQSPSSFHAISCENGVSPGQVGVAVERAGLMSHKVRSKAAPVARTRGGKRASVPE